MDFSRQRQRLASYLKNCICSIVYSITHPPVVMHFLLLPTWAWHRPGFQLKLFLPSRVPTLRGGKSVHTAATAPRLPLLVEEAFLAWGRSLGTVLSLLSSSLLLRQQSSGSRWHGTWKTHQGPFPGLALHGIPCYSRRNPGLVFGPSA